MMQRKMVGFDRRLDKEWLDMAAALMARGNTADDVRGRIKSFLEPGLGAEAVRKTLRVLGRLWWRAPKGLASMQSRALALLPDVSPSERIAIHWALCLAVYPFFLDTARLIGRLLSLQNEVKLQQLEVRIAELWGGRETIPRALQRITRSLVQWGVLQDTGNAGVYGPTTPISAKGDLGALLVEGLLWGQGQEGLTGEQVYAHPALFPFEVDVLTSDLRRRPEFEVFRQGVDVEFILLKK